MTSIQGQTPYQGWHEMKPNVSHLCEFSSPVWILHQGQNATRKFLPKLKRHAYVDCNDASQSVLYYNAKTQKILTSRNYTFLTIKSVESIKEIQVEEEDTPMHKGEQEDKDSCGVKEETEGKINNKCKELAEKDKPRRTRGVQPNYRCLNDPYSLEENSNETDDNENENLIVEVLMAEISDELHSLNEVKELPKWPE
jgi:hypothetical protein